MHFLSTSSVRWRKRMRNGLKKRQWSSKYYYNGRESRFTIRWILLLKPTAMPLFCSKYCEGAGGSACGGGVEKRFCRITRRGSLPQSLHFAAAHRVMADRADIQWRHNPSNRQGRTKVSVITLWRSYNLQTTKTKQQSQKQNDRFPSPDTFILHREKFNTILEL